MQAPEPGTSTVPPPWLPPVLLLVVLLALGAALYIGLDLYRGVVHGVFQLVRVTPVTAADGARYWLIMFGEGLGVATMLFVAGALLKLWVDMRKLK